jgi:type IV secretion system protein VirB1
MVKLRQSIFALYALAAAATALASSPRLIAGEPRLSDSQLSALLAECAPRVAPLTMRSVVGHESGRYPLRINVNGPYRLARQPLDLGEAVATARMLEASGHSFDVGAGQINNVNVKKYGLTWEQVFDPCTNLRVAEDILVRNFEASGPRHVNDQGAIRRALSRYNTGHPVRGFKNGYVAAVEAQARRLKSQNGS